MAAQRNPGLSSIPLGSIQVTLPRHFFFACHFRAGGNPVISMQNLGFPPARE
jgi:hypothetical protein